jgi:hypothetical protein
MYLAISILLLKMMFGHIVYDPHQLASKRRGCAKSRVERHEFRPEVPRRRVTRHPY